MTTLRSVLALALAAAALSCGGSPEPDTTPGKQPPVTVGKKVDVAIASVTLADDCGTGPTAVPPAQPQAQVQAGDSLHEPAAKRSAGASMSMARRACEQSSVQLRVANGTDAASKVTIQKVELLDARGAKVADLTPRAPSRWADDTYQAWDEQVAASATLQVSYALTAPSVARGATYTVRVTLVTGDGERTLEQPVHLEAEASLPPGVVT